MLRDVIAVETEIQRKLELEKRLTFEWLEKLRKEAGEEIAREEARLKEEYARSMKDARTDAEGKGREILGKAAAKAEAVKGLDGEYLRDITLKYIKRILPGGTP